MKSGGIIGCRIEKKLRVVSAADEGLQRNNHILGKITGGSLVGSI
jgi:hypothetical protein